MRSRLLLVTIATAAALAASAARGDHTGIAPCRFTDPGAPPGGSPGAPGGVVALTVVSASVKSGVDTDLPLVEDRGDVAGEIEIDGEKFALPEIEGSDRPTWDPSDGRFEKAVTGGTAAITIKLWDVDGGASGGRDPLDINPLAGNEELSLVFDLCSLRVSGDLEAPTAAVVEARGDDASATYQATLRFRLELADGRPQTFQDIALIDVDPVQVVHDSPFLVSGKKAVVVARVASNYPTIVDTALKLIVSGPGGFHHEETFPIDALQPGEVRRLDLFAPMPLVIPAAAPPGDTELFITAILDPLALLRDQYPADDCRRLNDEAAEMTWKIVDTRAPTLTWMRTGLALDWGHFAPEHEVDDLKALADGFIAGTFPVAGLTSRRGPDLSPPLTTGIDAVATLLGALGIPLDALAPFAMIYELDQMAAFAGIERMMGVLPDPGWFERFSHDLWAGVSGVSLGTYSPRAVLFVPKKGSPSGPPLVLPAHELGHTYGLSIDPRLKTSVLCGVEGDIGVLLCGATGGLDEYESDDPVLARGNPARGYWVPQGGEDPRIAALTGAPQCDRHCLMGATRADAHLGWEADGSWIDLGDYLHLIDALATHPDPAVIYVAGMINHEDQVYLNPWFTRPEGIPDRVDGDPGAYAFRFLDGGGFLLQEVGLPAHWGGSDAAIVPPVTAFGQFMVFPPQTARIEIWNRHHQAKIAERTVSPNAPEVGSVALGDGGSMWTRGDQLEISWVGSDTDEDPLTYAVLLRHAAGGQQEPIWAPFAWQTSATSFTLDTGPLPPGPWQVKVVAFDGIHQAESATIAFELVEPILFADDFESGDTAAWSGSRGGS